ncbi:protein TolB [Streptomyces sp. NBC_01381]|uniref:protein TolB n=1 Tax=Streptomyces sp. NBC_01381 TaxID=2903845 RepID=UPI00224E020C|nr:protein TolB [Streptomyces sp. NBC_01381]MCX4670231.1 protein TolB [Streptomyces sp. NBC_01381]
MSLSALLVAALGTTLLPAAAQAAPRQPPAPKVERVSVAADGTEADGASRTASISGNGRYVAFYSDAENLTEGHQGPYDWAFVKDLETGEVKRLKNSMAAPVISDDGRYAAHTGWGTHGINVFLTDLSTGEIKQIDGRGFKYSASSPAISANGRYVAYDLQPQHPGDPQRVEVYDRETDTRELISDGPPDSARDMVDPSISADGRHVAYEDKGTGQVRLRDRTTGSLTRIDDGTPSKVVEVSGRTVALNSADGAYVRDLRTGKVQRFAGKGAQAVSPDGRQLLYRDAESDVVLRDLRSGHEVTVGHGGARAGAIADKGKSVVYSSDATDVVPGDTNGLGDVFKWTAR